MQLMEPQNSVTPFPAHIRLLCVLTMALLVASTCIELAISLSLWWRGLAYPAIFNGWQQSMMELQSYTLPSGMLFWAGTLFLDMLSLIPYYLALLGTAWLFCQFYRGRVWVSSNIVVLKVIGALIIFDGVCPLIKDPLQLLLFSWSSKPILQVGFGLNSEMVRSFIIGFSVLVSGVVIDKARRMEDEIKLII